MTQHERFLERLRGSTPAVFAVARWLYDGGRTVTLRPGKAAPTAADHDEYRDSGDVLLDDGRRVEVKGISRDFNGLASWPFPRVYVAAADVVDRLGDTVAAWFTVNSALTHAAIVVPEITRERWYLHQHLAKNTGNLETVYACPSELAKWIALVKH